jgi:Protein-arginine deiminase (PAD)
MSKDRGGSHGAKAVLPLLAFGALFLGAILCASRISAICNVPPYGEVEVAYYSSSDTTHLTNIVELYVGAGCTNSYAVLITSNAPMEFKSEDTNIFMLVSNGIPLASVITSNSLTLTGLVAGVTNISARSTTNSGSSYDVTCAVIQVTCVDVTNLFLTHLCSGRSVTDTSRVDEVQSETNTMYLCESNGAAHMDMQAGWAPTHLAGSMIRWETVLTNEDATAQWGVTNSAGTWSSTSNSTFATNPVTLIWTNTPDGSGNTNREFKVRAWYDNDGDGKYTNTEPHRELYVTVLKLDLAVDTDRDGKIDDNDETGKGSWTTNRGAFVIPTCPYTNPAAGLTLNPTGLPPIVVRSPVGTLPSGLSLRLFSPLHHLGPGEGVQELRLFTTNGAEVLGYNDTNEYYSITNAVPPEGLVFYVAVPRDRSYADTIWTDGKPTLELQVVDAETNVIGHDAVQMMTAPLILPWNGCPIETIYGATNMPSISKLQTLPGLSSTNVWVQDAVEFAISEWGDGKISDHVISLHHHFDGDGEIVSALKKGESFWRDADLGIGGNGGDIEVSPPLPGQPFGSMITGTRCNTKTAISDFIEMQGVQTNFIVLDTSWLWVGHVDEMISFIDSNRVLIADPWTAADLLHEDFTNTLGTNTIWFGTNYAPAPYRSVTHLSVAAATFSGIIPALTYLATSIGSTDTHIITSNAYFGVGDFLRVDNEILNVTTATFGTTGVYTVVRAQAGRPSTPHAIGSIIYALSATLRENLPVLMDGTSPQEYMDAVTNSLSTQLGTHGVSFVKIPVLFGTVYDELESKTYYLAKSANMVNCVVDPDTSIWMSDPGSELFRNDVTAKVPLAQFVDVWWYHCNQGEIHCATQARRTIDLSTSWWSQFSDWH